MEDFNFEEENKIISPEEKSELEEMLWQKAEEFSMLRVALQARVDELEKIFDEKPTNSLNLHQEEERRKEEDIYWRTKEKISEIEKEEDAIEKVLLDLGEGVVDMEKLRELLPDQSKEGKELSKRKKRILEEKQRLGEDPRNIMGEMYGEFSNETARLTTGRHARRLKGNISSDPLAAAYEFFDATTDRHGAGGKFKPGKRGDAYIGRGGRRIRKT